MGLLNFDLKGGLTETFNRIKSPLERFSKEPIDVAGAVSRNDFKTGFEIVEIENGVVKRNERVLLLGDSMPFQPFTYGGNQKIVKDYYPGNTEPTVQVLGPRENSITIRGVLKAKKLARGGSSPLLGNAAQIKRAKERDSDLSEQIRQYPKEMQELIDAIRIRGNLVRFTMGDIQRFGFIEDTNFNLRTLAHIEYEITFSIVGFNPPSDCKTLGRARTIPFDINKQVINAVNAFQATASNIPPSIPRTLSEQLTDGIGDIAQAVTNITDFVNGILNEVDNLKAAVARAQGLIQNTKNQMTSFQRRLGNNPEAGASKNTDKGITSAYINADYTAATFTGLFSLSAFIASLSVALAKIAETEPLARHRVQVGDTLQKIAIKFYQDSGLWEDIFTHNKLQSTDLSLIQGDILEIPRQA